MLGCRWRHDSSTQNRRLACRRRQRDRHRPNVDSRAAAIARRLREELEAYLTEEMPALADLLAEVRRDLRSRDITPDQEVWQEAIDEELRVLLAQRKYRQAKTRLLKALGAGELVEELVGVASGERT